MQPTNGRHSFFTDALISGVRERGHDTNVVNVAGHIASQVVQTISRLIIEGILKSDPAQKNVSQVPSIACTPDISDVKVVPLASCLWDHFMSAMAAFDNKVRLCAMGWGGVA
jgi:hypothetical protein